MSTSSHRRLVYVHLREFVCLNYRHLGPGARGKAALNCQRGGGGRRHPRSSNATLADILCEFAVPLRVWRVFSHKWVSRSGGAHSFLFFQHLPNGSSIFSYNRSEPQKCRELQSFLIASKNERFSLEVLQKSSR